MKKIIILSGVLLMGLCACKNNQNVSEQPVPETFEEFMDGLNDLEECFEYSVSSDDSVSTSFLTYWCHLYDMRSYDPKEIHSAEDTNDSVANLLAEQKAINDSILEREMAIMHYVDNSMKYLCDKYRSKAAKYYAYETHRKNTDTLEYIIAPKELEDTLPEDFQGTDFKENFKCYPEFLTFNRVSQTSKKGQNIMDLVTYHKEEKYPGKKLTNEEEIKQIFLERISNVKGMKAEPVKYLSDDGKGFDVPTMSFDWRLKNEQVTQLDGVLYELPLNGEQKVALLRDLRAALLDFMKTHYAPYMELNFYHDFKLADIHAYHGALMGLSINNNRGSGHASHVQGLFRVQVGNVFDKSLKILFLNVRNEHFMIPREWMEIKEIHNDTIRWLPNGIYHNGTVTTTNGKQIE